MNDTYLEHHGYTPDWAPCGEYNSEYVSEVRNYIKAVMEGI